MQINVDNEVHNFGSHLFKISGCVQRDLTPGVSDGGVAFVKSSIEFSLWFWSKFDASLVGPSLHIDRPVATCPATAIICLLRLRTAFENVS